MKIKHIIIIRLALKWGYKNLKMSWKEWLKNSIYLMDTYCRPSLKNQTNQDFEILSLVDSSVTEYGSVLPNEKIIKLDKKNINLSSMIEAISGHILQNYKNCTHILLTRLDRDDSLEKNFINNVKSKIKGEHNQYIDTKNVIQYDSNNKIFYNCSKYNKNGSNMVSPFVTTFEKINKDNKIEMYSFKSGHSRTLKFIPGEKYNDLIALQVLHDTNYLNTVKGTKVKNEIDLENFGISIK